jgi:hypothetical protein
MSTPQLMYLSAISRHVDDLETLVDRDCLANARPQALSNLLARLARLQHTIATAARK